MDVGERTTTVIELLPQVPDVITDAASGTIERIADLDVAAAAEAVGELAVDKMATVGEGTTVATRSVIGVVHRHPKTSIGLVAFVVGVVVAVWATRRKRQPQQLDMLD